MKKTNDLLQGILDSISPEEQLRTDKKMILATKIAHAIKYKGFSKSEFAKVMGKNPSEISKWISGTHNFTFDTLISIEVALEIDLINTDYNKGIEFNFESLEAKGLKVNDLSYFLKDLEKKHERTHSYNYRLAG